MARGSGGSTNGKARTSPSRAAAICRMTRGQVGALDLRVGELGARLEVLFRVQPDADAVGDAAAAALALVGAGLGDRLDGQPLHLGAQAVAADAGGAGVDHVADAGDGERGLGDVGGEHHAAAGSWCGSRAARRPGAARRRTAGRRAAARRVFARPFSASAVSRISCSPDRKTRMSPGPSRSSSSIASVMACDLVAVLVAVAASAVADRAVADLDRVGAAGDLDDRRGLAGPGVRSARRTAPGRSSRR